MNKHTCVHKHCEFGGLAGPVARIISEETIAATEDTTRADAIEQAARDVLDWYDSDDHIVLAIGPMERLRALLK